MWTAGWFGAGSQGFFPTNKPAGKSAQFDAIGAEAHFQKPANGPLGSPRDYKHTRPGSAFTKVNMLGLFRTGVVTADERGGRPDTSRTGVASRQRWGLVRQRRGGGVPTPTVAPWPHMHCPLRRRECLRFTQFVSFLVAWLDLGFPPKQSQGPDCPTRLASSPHQLALILSGTPPLFKCA